MTLLEPWMDDASCARHPELAWLSDADQVGIGEAATMAVICDRCLVHRECAAFVKRESIDGGFWAGEHREELIETDTVDGAA